MAYPPRPLARQPECADGRNHSGVGRSPDAPATSASSPTTTTAVDAASAYAAHKVVEAMTSPVCKGAFGPVSTRASPLAAPEHSEVRPLDAVVATTSIGGGGAALGTVHAASQARKDGSRAGGSAHGWRG